MSPRRAPRTPTFRDLHANLDARAPRGTTPTRRMVAKLIEDDPDLAPAARHETPLSAWA